MHGQYGKRSLLIHRQHHTLVTSEFSTDFFVFGLIHDPFITESTGSNKLMDNA